MVGRVGSFGSECLAFPVIFCSHSISFIIFSKKKKSARSLPLSLSPSLALSLSLSPSRPLSLSLSLSSPSLSLSRSLALPLSLPPPPLSCWSRRAGEPPARDVRHQSLTSGSLEISFERVSSLERQSGAREKSLERVWSESRERESRRLKTKARPPSVEIRVA